MNILTNQQIREELKSCRPTTIAVAYVGKDWESYVDYSSIDKIVVSPTIGTNPYAIKRIVSKIGWDKVFFLDELHSKIYIGNNSTIIGSSNLTSNGLEGNSLYETCVVLKDKASLLSINGIFKDILKKSESKYPNEKSKKEKLMRLEALWTVGVSNSIIANDLEKRAFSSFELLGADHFYVNWFGAGDLCYSEELQAIEDNIADLSQFTSRDKIQKGKWVLNWKSTINGKPYKIKKLLSWLLIHDVYSNGVVEEEDYTTCAVELHNLKKTSPPFEITDEVTEAFKKAITIPEISTFLVQDNIYNLQYSFGGTELLINEMKKILLETTPENMK